MKETSKIIMTPSGYAQSIIMLMQSGNTKGMNIAKEMIHQLCEYYFETDPQFKEKTK